MGMVAGEASCTSHVLSTSPALPCHKNCLYVLNAAAQENISHPANVLLKLAFLNASVKEMLTCIPQLDEQILTTAKLYMTVYLLSFCLL